MALKVAQRGVVPPFIVMDVMRAAAEREAAGDDVLHLEVGQPGTGAPAGAVAAARDAVGRDTLGYTLALGIEPLRQRIARHYEDYYGVTVPADRVVVTTGSSGAFLLTFLTCFEAGDRVALADPGYPAYRNILKAVGVETVHLPTTAETRFQPTPALLDAVPGGVDGLIIASPSNPAGTMLDADALAALATYCTDHGIRLVSDEIYHGICFREPAATALASSDSVVIINSFSKYFSMDGLAARLDDRAGGPAPAGRVPGAEPVHLAADPVAGGGGRRLRLHRRTRCQCGALCGETARFCWTGCHGPASTGWRRRTAHSISMPMSPR